MLQQSFPSRPSRLPILMLVLATLFWGMGFAWAKNLGEAFNHAAGMPDGSTLGPTIALATRFAMATVLWLAIFPAARRGWTRGTWWRGSLIGMVLAVSIIMQHLGLDLASEATTAFLTNLTVVFIPLLLAIGLLRLPKTQLLVAIPFALAGIWLLTGARYDGFSRGETLVVLSAVGFSVQILLMNWLIPQDAPVRITVLMFAAVAIVAGGVSMVSDGFWTIDWMLLLRSPWIVTQWALMVVLVTLVAFGLMNQFQPQVDPTRAGIVYLCEPIFAALFAWLTEGATMSGPALAGAGLIVAANGIAELKWTRPSKAQPDAAAELPDVPAPPLV